MQTSGTAPRPVATIGTARHRALQLAVAAAAALIAAGGATGGARPSTTLYVDRSPRICSDSGPGTSARPFCLIGEAASVARPGQTVRVAAGTYTETVTVRRSGTKSAPIVITAAPGATVVVKGRSGSKGRSGGFHVWGKHWVTVNGFHVTETVGYGIDVHDSSHVRLTNNRVSRAGTPVHGLGRSGIYLGHVADSVVSGNTVDHNTSYGINVVGGSTRLLVRGNLSFANAQVYERAASGIRVYASPGNTLSANVVYGNEDSGIEFDNSTDALATGNVAFDNGDHGVDIYRSPRATIIGNISYSNIASGIDVEGTSPGATIARNTSADNAIAGPRNRGNIRVDASSTDGTTMDRDLVYLSTPDVLLIWGDVQYPSIEALRTATGQELHGTEAEPQWTNCELDQQGPLLAEQFRVVGTSCATIRGTRR